MARKKYNYNFVRKPSEGGKEALYMAGASVFLFLLASVVSFAFRGNGGIFLGAAGLFSFLLSGYGFYVGMKSFKEEQVSHRMSVLGSITSGGMLVAWLALFLDASASSQSASSAIKPAANAVLNICRGDPV